MAYAGTSNSGALKRLLHVAVSDVSDDVRRAATLNVGFILFNEPEQVKMLIFEEYMRHLLSLSLSFFRFLVFCLCFQSLTMPTFVMELALLLEFLAQELLLAMQLLCSSLCLLIR